ncbi:MAG: (d)CMP kinase [Bdellovibrionota bacterium]
MSGRRKPIVAVDGPAGAGKSTVSRAVAARLGYLYIDTGAMYRAAALAAERAGLDKSDDKAVEKFCKTLEVGFGPPSTDPAKPAAVLLSEEDVSALIRTPEMSMAASTFSAKQPVRRRLTEIQRRLGASGGVVMEGRDIGTVVFPDAEAKFFLTASLEERARRRQAELAAKGQEIPLAKILEDVAVRDRQDSSREQAPLVQAPDAHLVDSTGLTISEVIDRIVNKVRSLERS